MKTHLTKFVLFIGLVTLFSANNTSLAQGNLTPPGAPAPTMKSLDQVAPRIPISTVGFVISSPGSYYLTTNLIVGQIIGNGISIVSGNVNLDLNGFSIIGVDGTANGLNVSGIYVQGSQSNIAIYNGSVSLWRFGVNVGNAVNSRFENILMNTNGFFSLQTGDNCTVKNCRASYLAGGGIQTGANCILSQCSISQAGAYGFSTGIGCTLDRCTAQNCTGDGFDIGNGNVLNSCIATANKGSGFSCGTGVDCADCNAQTNNSHGFILGNYGRATHCVANGSVTGSGFNVTVANITSCTANQNALYGFDVERSFVLNCEAHNNLKAGIRSDFAGRVQGCFAVENALYGITSDAGGVVEIIQNTCQHNGTLAQGGQPIVGAGIFLTNSVNCIVQENTCAFNYLGIQVAINSATTILHNRCSLNSTNYVLGTGNSWGPIVNISGVGDISSTANANHPQANFSF